MVGQQEGRVQTNPIGSPKKDNHLIGGAAASPGTGLPDLCGWLEWAGYEEI